MGQDMAGSDRNSDAGSNPKQADRKDDGAISDVPVSGVDPSALTEGEATDQIGATSVRIGVGPSMPR